MNGTTNYRPLIWGIVLILVGLLFLLHSWNLLSLRVIWRLIVDWWPLILIFIGARKIYRYFALRQN